MKWVHMNNKIDINDNELISLLPEDEENIKNIIFDKYGYLIKVLMHKYYNVIKLFQVDEQEVYSEASYGFSDGINSYRDSKNTSLKTFLSICIERRITNLLSKYTTQKSKFINETLSLDYEVLNGKTPLIEIISDDSKNDPLNSLTSLETYAEIIDIAKETLSEFEYTVFTYLINEVSYQEIARLLEKNPKQIDNTIQRIKAKMRIQLENVKIDWQDLHIFRMFGIIL